MRTREEFELVIQLKQKGKNNSEISRITGIPRGTVKDWINNPPKHFVYGLNKKSMKDELVENKEMHSTYSYLLGLYLGDGYINKCERTFRMRIALDKKYDALNEYAKSKMEEMFVGNKVGVVNYENHINISVYNSQIAELFPQHEKGVKHSRDVSLMEWQEELIIPKELLKGLFHSDGCYYLSRGYDFYKFDNKSNDLLKLFKKCCDELEIEYTYGEGIVRIYRRNSVNKLKNIIGDKNEIK